jgi:hypothetical protein
MMIWKSNNTRTPKYYCLQAVIWLFIVVLVWLIDKRF